MKVGKGCALEFRDGNGELVSKSLDLPDQLKSNPFMISNGREVFVAGKDGVVFRATRQEFVKHCDAGQGAKSALEHLAIYKGVMIAIVKEPTGLTVRQFDRVGQLKKEAKSDVKQISGNAAIIEDKLYFFDPDHSELVVCDLKNMRILDAIELPNVQVLRTLVGLSNAKEDILMLAGSDAAGQLGSVFLLDPKTGDQTLLCSTNQPHVDVMFACERAVVATSSSYQNIIRVFEPFVSAKSSEQAA